MRRQSILRYLGFFVLSLLPLSSIAEEYKVQKIKVLTVNSAITPATMDYLEQNIHGQKTDEAFLIELNTPGGLVSTTKDIITLIGNSNSPVIIWITPEGASASSAGAIIASAAHFIFMSPGTNMGAATPIGMGGDIQESDGKKKALNDLSAMVRSLSEERSRNPKPFEEMIREAKSFTDKEAMKLKLIDGVSSSREDLISQLDGKIIRIKGKEFTVQVNSPQVQELEANMGQRILAVLANPELAYLLFLLGIALIYFEFQAPGGFVAGTIGFTLLILAAMSFQVLPLHWGSLGFMILGVALLVLEIFVVSYGLLTLAGLAVFILGSLFLFKGDEGFITIEYPVLYSTLAGVTVSVGFIVWYLLKDAKKQKQNISFFLPIGVHGVVMKSQGFTGMIKVRGEFWKYQSNEEFTPGDKAEVIEADTENLTVKIKSIH
jgi:membrane-bound serine protease (ClpP class)